MQEKKSLINDKVVKKLFTSGSKTSEEYLLKIISGVTDIPYDKLKEDFQIIYPEVGVNTNYINHISDLVYENNDTYFSIEINKSDYPGLVTKNFAYVCSLYLRQIKNKKDYPNLKKIYSINIDNFDIFNKNEFIYKSYMKEEKYNIIRQGINIYCIDINLDYLRKKGYTKLKEANILETLLYIFVGKDEKEIENIYKGDKLMEKVVKEVKSIVDDLDMSMYFDEEQMDNEILYYEGEKAGHAAGLAEGHKNEKIV